MSTPSADLSAPSGHRLYLLWALVVTALVVAVYWSGLQGPFLLDDKANILLLPTVALDSLNWVALKEAAASSGSGRPDRALARLTFALNHYFAGGFEVLHFKITNLLVHLISTALVAALAVRLLARHAAITGREGPSLAGQPWWRWAALLAATLWALHPLQVSTVLYVVQRMTSMSAMFVLAGVLSYTIGRERLEAGRRGALAWMWGGSIGFGLLGVLCKENAVLLPLWLALVEIVFFRGWRDSPSRRALAGFHLVCVAVPVLIGLAVLAWQWDTFVGHYQYRSYDMWERVLTQARVLWFYLGLLALPNLREFGLHHDDIAVSSGLLEPWTTALALAAWVAVVAIALFGLRRRSLFAFVVLWYLIGHAIESSIISLEMVFEHRNYIPSVGPFIGIAVAVVVGLSYVFQRARVAVVVALVMVTGVSGVTFARANLWENKYALTYFGLRNHPDSPRYLREWAAELAQRPQPPTAEVFALLQRAAALKEDDVSSLFDMARFVDRELAALGQPPVTDVPAESLAQVDALSTPLEGDVMALNALALAIDREISRRVDGNALSVNSVELGRHMEACLNRPDPGCKRMVPAATRWTERISVNPRLAPNSRAFSAVARAKMLAWQGDLDGALESLELAASISPKGIMIRFEKAALMLTLGRLDDAAAALDEAESLQNWGGLGSRLLASMRKRLAEQRLESQAPGAGAVAK